MTRYNTIHQINDTWGSYEEKGKTPQWVNLKALDNQAMALLKNLDAEGEYKALWKYSAE